MWNNCRPPGEIGIAYCFACHIHISMGVEDYRHGVLRPFGCLSNYNAIHMVPPSVIPRPALKIYKIWFKIFSFLPRHDIEQAAGKEALKSWPNFVSNLHYFTATWANYCWLLGINSVRQQNKAYHYDQSCWSSKMHILFESPETACFRHGHLPALLYKLTPKTATIQGTVADPTLISYWWTATFQGGWF